METCVTSTWTWYHQTPNWVDGGWIGSVSSAAFTVVGKWKLQKKGGKSKITRHSSEGSQWKITQTGGKWKVTEPLSLSKFSWLTSLLAALVDTDYKLCLWNLCGHAVILARSLSLFLFSDRSTFLIYTMKGSDYFLTVLSLCIDWCPRGTSQTTWRPVPCYQTNFVTRHLAKKNILWVTCPKLSLGWLPGTRNKWQEGKDITWENMHVHSPED